MEIVRLLAEEIGPRPAGTAAEAEAARRISTAARTAGAAVECRDFLFQGWSSGEDGVLRTDADGNRREIRGRALPYTSGTPAEGVSGTLRRIGDWPLIPGRFVCPRYHLEDASGRLVAAVMVCPFGEARALPNPHPLASMPTLVIGDEDGRALAAAVDHDPAIRVPATLRVSTWSRGLLRSVNVVADVGHGPRRVLVVAHLDSVAESPGANDNASGVETAVRLLRRYGEEPPGDTALRFLFTGAEEPFLVGARAYAGTLVASGEAASVVACLNLDMVAVGERFVLRRPLGGVWHDAASRAARAVPAPGPLAAEPSTAASDHWAFHEVGIDSAQLTRVTDHHYHTHDDVLPRITAGALDDAAAMANVLVEHALGADEQPTSAVALHGGDHAV